MAAPRKPASRYAATVVSDAEPGATGWQQIILARLQAGDDLALAQAYDFYGAFVYGLARRVTANEQAAQDITQDVFARLWERPEAVDLQRGSMRSFLGALCHHRSVDLIRREERRRSRESKVGLWAEPQSDVAEAATVVVLADQVRRAVAMLPENQREALTLAYFEGNSYREVAIQLGIPEGTAKSRLRLALGTLAELLQADRVPK